MLLNVYGKPHISHRPQKSRGSVKIQKSTKLLASSMFLLAFHSLRSIKRVLVILIGWVDIINLFPLSDFIALREVNPIRKKGSKCFPDFSRRGF